MRLNEDQPKPHPEPSADRSARLGPESPLCEHVEPGGWPFTVELVLDEQIGFTDALVTCRTCGAAYLLEMLDWRGRQRLMRVSTVESERTARLLHNLGRGSCDVRRAGAEVEALKSSSTFSPWLLLMDATATHLEALLPVPETLALPSASWRELPCDGGWLARVL